MSAATADNFFSDHWQYLIAALILHAGLIAVLVVGIGQSRQSVVPQLAIKAVVIDNTAKRLKREQAEAEQRAREQAEAEQREREAAEAKEREAAAEVKRQEEAAEQLRQQEREAAAKKAAATKAAADKKRLDEIKAKQQEQQRKEREAREQAQRESELKRQLAEEEGRMQAESAGLLNQYVAMIQQRVTRNWNRPATARPGISCDVTVTQAPGGTVLSVKVGKCNGDAAVRQSIEAAVHRSSPLPAPPDARLFQRDILFVFNPKD